MSHQRVVPTNADGVEMRFPGRQDPNDVYDRNRCRVCGVSWVHPQGDPMKVVMRPNGDKDLIPQDHEHISPGCAGRRPPSTLFDVVEETKHKGAYG